MLWCINRRWLFPIPFLLTTKLSAASQAKSNNLWDPASPLSYLGRGIQRSSCQLAILYNWQLTVYSIHVCLPSRSWNSPQILSWFLRLCDVGVKYLKWSKLGELVAKILINCFKAVKFTEILTQQRCTLTVPGSSNSIYWVNLTDSLNQYLL